MALVYIMRWNDLGYKIGCTAKTLKQRWPVRSMRAMTVLTIETDESPYKLESELHRMYAGQRVSAQPEVFALTEKHIEQLLEMPGAQRYAEEQ